MMPASTGVGLTDGVPPTGFQALPDDQLPRRFNIKRSATVGAAVFSAVPLSGLAFMAYLSYRAIDALAGEAASGGSHPAAIADEALACGPGSAAANPAGDLLIFSVMFILMACGLYFTITQTLKVRRMGVTVLPDGLHYTEPLPDAPFVPWSEVKRIECDQTAIRLKSESGRLLMTLPQALESLDVLYRHAVTSVSGQGPSWMSQRKSWVGFLILLLSLTPVSTVFLLFDREPLALLISVGMSLWIIHAFSRMPIGVALFERKLLLEFPAGAHFIDKSLIEDCRMEICRSCMGIDSISYVLIRMKDGTEKKLTGMDQTSFEVERMIRNWLWETPAAKAVPHV